MSALESVLMAPTAAEAALSRDVLAAAGGDRDAFGRLVDGTRNLVCSISLAVVRDLSASEDVAQEVYLAAWQSLPRLRNSASFLPWLRQLTRNRAHDQLRRGIRLAPDAGLEADALVDDRPDARARMIAGEERAALAAALEQLPDAAREVVTLYYREGRSLTQVAALLGVSEEAAKKRLSRARAELRAATLDKLGESLARSAPAAAFSAAILGAITAGAPATAAAAATATKVGSAGSFLAKLGGTSLLAKLVGVVGGAGLGALGGSLGVITGMRRLLARARDDEERRQLIRFTRINVIATTLGAVAMPLGNWLWPGGAGLALGFGVLWAVIMRNYMWWLPRIIARREALERSEDPRAHARQRRQRILSLVGMAFGTLAGGGTVVYVIYMMHR